MADKDLIKAAEKVVKAQENAKAKTATATKPDAETKKPEQPVTEGATTPSENLVSSSEAPPVVSDEPEVNEGGDGSSRDDIDPPAQIIEQYEGPQIYVCLSEFLFQINGSLTSFKEKQLVNDPAMIIQLIKAKMPVVPAYDYAFYTQCPNCRHHFPARRNSEF